MAKNISVPEIGDFNEVEIIEVLVKPGDKIKKNDPIVTLESDKSSVEVPSPFEGKISELKVKIGDRVSEGSILAIIDGGAEKKDINPKPIIETKDLLNDPKNILSSWCKNINIDFEQSMLSWEKGVHQYDGIWWEYWYDNVIKTKGFLNYQKKDINIENKYVSIYNESMEYYNYLKSLK